jgi:hypothetical protein
MLADGVGGENVGDNGVGERGKTMWRRRRAGADEWQQGDSSSSNGVDCRGGSPKGRRISIWRERCIGRNLSGHVDGELEGGVW